jgi:hypothetical protein
MAEIIDLALLTDSERLLNKILDRHGLGWFIARDGERLMALERAKIELVVRTAIRARERMRQPVAESAAEHCRKQVRRSLIRKVALAMVRAGC